LIKILNDIEKKVATSATSELFKIAFFIGFIPCVIALLCDFGLLKVIFIDLNTSKDFKGFDSVMKTLIPNNSIYMNILSFYTISQMVLLYILGFCVHLKKKIFPRILWFCEFFSPVAEILLQLLAVISGVFLAVALLMIFSTEPYSSIIFFVISLFVFFLSVAALTINRVITHNYQNL
jgi:hypothetical protein